MSLSDVATLATAGFAAVAAGASWVSVSQTRKERIAAQTPLMSIDFSTPTRSSEVRVQILNHGPAVRGVEFAVAVDGQMCFSVTEPPSFAPGEIRTILPAINHTSSGDPIGFVSCYDISGGVLHVWWPQGDSKVFHARDRPGERPSRQDLMRVTVPNFSLSNMTLVGFRNASPS